MRYMNIITRFENEVVSVLKSIPANAILLAAVSGGADSMAMLTALHSLSQSSISNFTFSVLHVEHGLRCEEESLGDAEFVRAFCEERGIECRVKRIQSGRIASYAKRKGIGIEAAARFFRRRALHALASQLKQRALLGEEAAGADVCILTAHTKSDLLETTLMRILRGCGPAGLAGMKKSKELEPSVWRAMNNEQRTESKEQRAMNREQRAESREQRTMNREQRIVRPLIDLSRGDVIAYLNAKGILWRDDSTNADNLFLRNRIRNRLVPLLDEAFPSWRAGVDAMAETQSLAAEFIADEARRRVIWKEETMDRYSKDQIGSNAKNSQTSLNVNCSLSSVPSLSTDEKNFFAQQLIVREEAIFQAVDTLIRKMKNPRSVKRAVVRRFCAKAEREGGVKTADFGVVTARREGGKVIVSRKRKEFFECGVSVLIENLML